MPYLKTAQLLNELENELRLQSLWSSEKPSEEAMNDTSPFSCEAMSFENWVQFILIPKMHHLIDSTQSLPTNIAIAPMAHHVWSSKQSLHTLILIFDNLDTLLSEQR